MLIKSPTHYWFLRGKYFKTIVCNIVIYHNFRNGRRKKGDGIVQCARDVGKEFPRDWRRQPGTYCHWYYHFLPYLSDSILWGKKLIFDRFVTNVYQKTQWIVRRFERKILQAINMNTYFCFSSYLIMLIKWLLKWLKILFDFVFWYHGYRLVFMTKIWFSLWAWSFYTQTFYQSNHRLWTVSIPVRILPQTSQGMLKSASLS